MTTPTTEIDLRGKRALVTGGSRGIGAATVRMLAGAGADITIGYRNRTAAAEAVATEVTAAGQQAYLVSADISTASGAEELVKMAVSSMGGLDIFVANAGIWPPEDVPLASMGDDQWNRTLRHNLDSVFYTSRAVVNSISDGGSIVIVSSTAGQRGEANHSDYAATKGAVISFAKSLAVELGHRDINVNCVAPGWVDTEMVQTAIANSGNQRINSTIPLGRIATADDIAGPIVFLCSALARHITGEILNVNGGSVLCG
ncbi:MAG: SDR family oxidoreductase [Gemmatimonadaceae bacterium]